MGKKNEEMEFIRIFQKVFPEFPQGQIEEHEKPDFLIRTPSCLLGIEVTRLYCETPEGKRPMTEQEGLQTQILRGAKNCYDRDGNPPIHVSVHFKTLPGLRKADVDHLANQIVRIVREEMLAKGIWVIREDEDNWEWWPPTIAFVIILRNAVLTRSTWVSSVCGFFPELHPKLVQAALDGKNSSVPTYRQRCSKLWLLMVAVGSGMSLTFDITPEIEPHHFRASFDRAFLLQCFEGKFLELKIVPPQTEATPE